MFLSKTFLVCSHVFTNMTTSGSRFDSSTSKKYPSGFVCTTRRDQRGSLISKSVLILYRCSGDIGIGLNGRDLFLKLDPVLGRSGQLNRRREWLVSRPGAGHCSSISLDVSRSQSIS